MLITDDNFPKEYKALFEESNIVSSIATAIPLVKILQGMSAISLERYIAVVPPSRKRDMPSSISVAAFCAMTILASVLMVVFFVYASPETCRF